MAKKFSFKNNFQTIEIEEIELESKTFENVKITSINAEFIDEDGTYKLTPYNLLKNILRKDKRNEEIIETLKKDLTTENIMEVLNGFLEELQGK